MRDFFDQGNRTASWPLAERRQSGRQPSYKSAEIIFGPDQQVHKGLVLDESPDGVLLDLGKIIEVPSAVMFRYSYGSLIYAINRWSAKTEIGLQFIDHEATAYSKISSVEDVVNVLEKHGPDAAFHILRDRRFFDNDQLKKLAEDAVAANFRLKSALHRIR
jgi:hypothetical protein